MAYTMTFAADIVPTKTNEQYFVAGDAAHLFGEEMLRYLASVDFRCFNLETPLTTSRDTALYPGPYLRAAPEAVNAIAKLDPSLLTLGNNHALDQGEAGFRETVATLTNAGLAYTGAGGNLEEAAKPFIVEADQGRIGIFNCSEYEFAAATERSCGANPYDPLASFDQVRALKERCDVVIVLYHGGKEFYRYPSPDLRRVCRKFADCGAALVICQHTHCIGCEETYRGSRIVYGQGNLLFDRKENEFKKTGMFVQCEVDGGAIASIRYVPFRKAAECVRLADAGEAAAILEGFRERSGQIESEAFVRDQYDRLARESYGAYVQELLGRRRLVRLLNRLTRGRFLDRYYTNRQALAVLNAISPENHGELLKAALRLRGGR